MPVKIQINPNTVTAKVVTAWDKGLKDLSDEILADCNEFCKDDQDTLIRSSYTHSKPEKGKLIWQTDYAKRQYWEIRTAIKDKNPNASWKWCEVAKRRYKNRWKELAEMKLRENL